MSEPTTISLLTQHAEKITAELKKSVGNDIEWREKQAEQWGFIRAHIESQSAFNDSALRWQREHQKTDDENFDILSAKIDARVGAVSSSVGEIKETENQFKGARKIAGWLGAAFIAIIGAFIWLGAHIIMAIESIKSAP